MSRPSWKIPFISPIFFTGLFKKTKVFNIWQRGSVIPAYFVNRKFKIHNGIWLLTLNVTSSMVGHKFGEFAFTKRMGADIHKPKKKIKKRKK